MNTLSRWKIAVGVLAGLALIAVTVIAATTPGPAVPATTETSCTGQCTDCATPCPDCPAVAAQSCPTGSCGAEACATVDTARCIGCGACVLAAPEAYIMNPDTGRAEIKPGASAEAIARGARACPVDAVNL